MLVSARNKTAAILAIVGGVFILIAGGTGMVNFLIELSDIVQELLGGSNELVSTIFWILIFIAALGGIAVMIGGFLIYKNRTIAGKIFVTLGAGMGIIGLLLGLISAAVQGEELAYYAWLTTSFMGIGIVLSLVARYVAK